VKSVNISVSAPGVDPSVLHELRDEIAVEKSAVPGAPTGVDAVRISDVSGICGMVRVNGCS
jgi:hypothetical protein